MLRSLVPLIALCMVCLTASPAACATPAAEDLDPLEAVNRISFDFSMFVDRNALRPVAEAYVAVVPDPVRNGLRDCIDNLESPIVFANDLLQGDGDAAGNTMARFLINTTIGIGGLMDPAAAWGLTQDDEDFGITLGRWGDAAGPYLFIPLFGPSSPRDAFGYVTDLAFDPLTYWKGSMWVPIGEKALDIVDSRARNLESIDAIERTSVDDYAAVRSAYRQSRAAKVNKGASDVPDFSSD